MATTEKRRRQYGTGTVYQRGDGLWIGRYRNGFTRSGAVAYKSVSASTEKACRAKLNKALANRNSETPTLDSRTTVKAWCDEWLPRQQKRVRPSGYNADRGAVNNWIVPNIGARKLHELTPRDIRKVHDAVSAKRAQSTAIRVHATLMGALKAASLEGHTIPARIFQVPPPAQGQSDRTEVSVADAIALLKAAETDPRRSRWVAALMQGMRQGECLGLTWEHIDLERGLLDISWQLQPLPYAHGCLDDAGKATCGKKRAGSCTERYFSVPVGFEYEQVHLRWHLVRPKTASGQRTIPLLPWMVAALTEWRDRDDAPDSRLVWPALDGTPVQPKDDVLAWEALQEKVGVRHPDGRYYHLHECRHATATILMALGVDTQVIIAIMGHASILSTRRYQHADLEMMRAALAGVAERLQLTA